MDKYLVSTAISKTCEFIPNNNNNNNNDNSKDGGELLGAATKSNEIKGLSESDDGQQFLTQAMAQFLQQQFTLDNDTILPQDGHNNDLMMAAFSAIALQNASLGNNFDFSTLFNSQQQQSPEKLSNKAKNNNIDSIIKGLKRPIKNGAQLRHIIKNDKSEITKILTENFTNIGKWEEEFQGIPYEKLCDVMRMECTSCMDSKEAFVANDPWHLKEHLEQQHDIRSVSEKIVLAFGQRLEALLNNTGENHFIVKSCASAPPVTNKDNDPANNDCDESSDASESVQQFKRADSTPAFNVANNNSENGNDQPASISFIKNENLSRKRKAMAPEANCVSDNNNPLGEQFTAMMMAAASGNFNFLAAAAAAMAQNNSGADTANATSAFGTNASSSTSSVSSSNNNNGLISIDSSGTSFVFGDSSGVSPQKRARTRITDDQLKILRQYFDINNSPSEEQIKEMSIKAQLPEKVIKHWFRNTLFKERQRDKDSPYNFNVPPQMSIDLATYEKTGETKITSIKQNELEQQEKDHDHYSNSASPDSVSIRSVTETGRYGDNDEQVNEASTSALNQSIKDESIDSPQNSPRIAKVQQQQQQEPQRQHSTEQQQIKAENFLNSDFFTNLNKAAALNAANNYAAALMAQQQAQFPSDFASFFTNMAAVAAAASNPLDAVTDKTMSSVLASAGIPTRFPTLPSTSLITASLVSNNGSGVSSPVTNAAMSGASNLVVGSGRRANRTRFTDFQLRTLQNFFDRQAYPKDDDLEMLSKKLGLSPRVIVVWFQNARQKARKIYENQPNNVSATSSVVDNGADRFARTPGTNFQCKRCQLVFQRYYEFLQHQQTVCYLNDGEAQQSDNKSVEENLSEEEKLTANTVSAAAASAMGSFGGSLLNSLLAAAATGQSINPAELLSIATGSSGGTEQLLNSMLTSDALEKFNLSFNNNAEDNENATTSDVIDSNNDVLNAVANVIGDENSNKDISHDLVKLITSGQPSSETMLKMLKSRERKRAFYKRCPFCALLFHSSEKMSEHMTRKHSEQMLSSKIDIATLPDAEDVPSFLSATDELLCKLNKFNNGESSANGGASSSSPLDLSFSGNLNENEDPTFSPTFSRSEDNNSTQDDRIVDTFDDNSRAVSTSPGALLATATATITASVGGQIGSGLLGHFRHDQRSPASNLLSGNMAACAAAAAAAASNSKRYRTHLTPLQVYIMKSLFNDYKTPSMSECDVLGREIGLHKRVVQVWFQNARAKERKCKSGGILADSTLSNSDDVLASTSLNGISVHLTHCELCNVEFGSKNGTVQDHIFTTMHIERVKERGASLRGMSTSGSDVGSNETVEALRALSATPNTTSSKRASNLTPRRQSASSLASTGGGSANSPLSQFPYNLMYGMQSGALPLIYDPNLIGTPISMLQIPESVMQTIGDDLAKGRNSSRFTQDGLQLVQLSAKVSEADFKCAACAESEVGWACTQCSNVFQQESLLRNHQKLICQGSDSVFRLIQIYYECVPCASRFGTQDEFQSHCNSGPHKTAVR